MRYVRQFLSAATFLTRLPVPVAQMDRADLGESVWAFPFVGMLVGSISSAAYVITWVLLSSGPALPRIVLSAVTGVTATVLVTGGLHFDGLADTADGLASGKDRERTLEIMRDSRIGSAGAVWIGLDLMFRMALLISFDYSDGLIWLALAAGCGRFAQILSIVRFPYARQSGLGSVFSFEARPIHLLPGAIALIFLAATRGIIPVAAGTIGVGAGLLFAGRISRRLGGLTGDVYGATNEVVEVGVLLAGALISGGTCL